MFTDSLGAFGTNYAERRAFPMEHKQKKLPGAAVRAVVEQMASETDPLGSYTGRPLEEGEVPVQDADDL